jgi:hypothetical protein
VPTSRAAARERTQARTLCALAFGLLAAAVTVDARSVYFAEPYTGKKVTEYDVELPVDRTQHRAFSIPADCNAVVEAAARGAAQWGTRVESNVWWKVEHDCRYHAFLHRHEVEPVHDYVTGYDFMNAYLRDLPMGARCSYPGVDPTLPACQPLPPGVPALASLLPFTDRGADAHRLDLAPCRIRSGIFRGRVVRDEAGVHCEADPDAPGFRVISVDYADVNGDRVLDVVLRLIPLAPGASRMPIILPLTRQSPDEPFTVPEQVVVPPNGRAP